MRRFSPKARLGSRRLVALCLFCGLLAWAGPLPAQRDATRPIEGLRDRTPRDYVLTNASIVVRPGQVLERGTLVVRDGLIEQVGADVSPPAGLPVIDMRGKWIFPGLIDAYSEMEVQDPPSGSGAAYWNPLIRPQRRVSPSYRADRGLNAKYRSQGVCVRLVAPSDGILKGSSALVTTGDDGNDRAILSDSVCQHARLTVSPGRSRRQYPNSPMGAVALARQAMYDADWYRQAWKAYRSDSGEARPERNEALEALQELIGGQECVMVDAANELYFLRADRFAREFGLDIMVRGSGHEYRRLAAIAATGRAVIVPLNFPKAPNVGSAEAAADVSLQRMMHWDLAPENPARLHAAGVPIALTTHGLKGPDELLGAVRKAVARGLEADAALAALTTTPARLFGVSQRLGTLEGGRLAHFVVTDGPLFAEGTKVLETWVDGQRYRVQEPEEFDWRGTWELQWESPAGLPALTLQLEGQPRKLEGSMQPAGSKPAGSEPVKLARVSVRDMRLSAVFEGKMFDRPGIVQVTAVLADSQADAPEIIGQVVWPDGGESPLRAVRRPRDAVTTPSDQHDEKREKREERDSEDAKEGAAPGARTDDKREGAPEGERAAEPDAGDGERKSSPASFEVNFPLGAYGLEAPPEQPALVLFREATVWTCGEKGVLPKASVLVGGGRILAVGADLQAPAGAMIVDCAGKHLTPGIIDCHSHMATDGGVNESTQAVTAEVRIGDFIDADDMTIYRQLAGGVTASNILHGSANPIGGQNQVIKLRWGMEPEQMKFAEAPEGIKFALGENVKQSNWGDDYTSRYPQTRMGVEQIIRDELEAARDYAARWKKWRETGQGVPPRRDLQLDAMAEILAGKRWVHCHSYRQDEILALIRTLDEYGVTIGSFQHILEGYKVADEMARHGAMGSAFSDWWAYKFEVYDAIPYNGALMHQAGVVVSFNSDDRELGRHLNHEAAKATKYGGVPEEEALRFVTLNPARQLRIDPWVGSIEAGKHADLVIWSGPPLSTLTRCEQTWIDGRCYFDLQRDQQLREQARHMRTTLIQKILQSGEAMLAPGEADDAREDLWPREDIFCHGHDHGHHGHHGHR